MKFTIVSPDVARRICAAKYHECLIVSVFYSFNNSGNSMKLSFVAFNNNPERNILDGVKVRIINDIYCIDVNGCYVPILKTIHITPEYIQTESHQFDGNFLLNYYKNFRLSDILGNPFIVHLPCGYKEYKVAFLSEFKEVTNED